MTPKDKAKELFYKFYLVNSESVELETGEYDLVFSLDARDAKQCASIAVDEVVLHCNQYEWQYWIQVKQELEKL
jgi:hypothetical protein